ncbi:hypothetical protein D3C85_1184160 [compost metagenome]
MRHVRNKRGAEQAAKLERIQAGAGRPWLRDLAYGHVQLFQHRARRQVIGRNKAADHGRAGLGLQRLDSLLNVLPHRPGGDQAGQQGQGIHARAAQAHGAMGDPGLHGAHPFTRSPLPAPTGTSNSIMRSRSRVHHCAVPATSPRDHPCRFRPASSSGAIFAGGNACCQMRSDTFTPSSITATSSLTRAPSGNQAGCGFAGRVRALIDEILPTVRPIPAPSICAIQ